MEEHEVFVNTCCPIKKGPPLIISGADDGSIRIWDFRINKSSQTMWAYYPVTTVSSLQIVDIFYSGGIDNNIKIWDLRKGKVVQILYGHCDMITSLRISPNATYLLSNSMDNTLRIWNLRTYAMKNRSKIIFTGHFHTSEKNLLKCDWSNDGSYVSGGSGDCKVYIWEVESKKVVCKLPGHSDSVNEVVFHPNKPIIGSCSSDKYIHIGKTTK